MVHSSVNSYSSPAPIGAILEVFVEVRVEEENESAPKSSCLCQKSILNFRWAFMNYCNPADFWLLFIGHSDMG